MPTIFSLILAAFLTGATIIVLTHLPDFIELLLERLRPHRTENTDTDDNDTTHG